jgi:hypothetical protein
MEDIVIAEAASFRYFFKGQIKHFIAGAFLVVIAGILANPVLGDGSWLGVSDTTWFWTAIGLAVFHQVLVWVVFRGQLGWAIFTRWFGQKDLLVWGLMFLPLLVLRPMLLLGLAISDHHSLGLPSVVRWVFGSLLLLPSLYTLWSVGKYFGLVRALGGDHFREHYRTIPLESRGAFRWSQNAMYVFAFLGLWSFALIADSRAAMVLAAFEHVYVWAHYYATEKADMDLIYGA